MIFFRYSEGMSKPIKVKIKKLKEVKLPQYEYHGDAGLDLHAAERCVIKKGEKFFVSTGIALEIPEGYVGCIWDKSGLSMNHGLKTLGGVVDSGYRGEIIVGLANLSNNDYVVEKDHKVAQMIIQKKEHVILEETEKLSESQRDRRGFGSSGK